MLAGAAACLLLICVAAAFLPRIDEVGEAFPGELLREFRLASLTLHALIWMVIGALFGEFEAAG